MLKTSCILIAALTLSLTACQSVGLQYKFPAAGEKSAELQGVDGAFINNFNEKGCYYGRTSLSGTVRVRAGEPISIGYENEERKDGFGVGVNRDDEVLFCRLMFRFTPEENARYRLWKAKANIAGKNVFGLPSRVGICRLGLQQVMEDGSLKAIPVVPLSLHHVKWNCIQLKSVAEKKADAETEAN